MKTKKITAVILILLGLMSLWLLREQAPVIRLLAASLGMIWVIKCAAILWQIADGVRINSRFGLFLFVCAWPGISIQGFTHRKSEPPTTTGAHFLESWLSFILGFLLLIVVSIFGKGESTLLNYVALLSILLIVHLGILEILADGLRLLGFSPASLFDRPYLAASLRDFWSLRWNLAFVDMNKIFLLNPLRGWIPQQVLVLSIFAVSGLLHEIGISFADSVSWGKPLVYFLLQGTGMAMEKYRKFPRALVWIWIALPLPLLFTPSFTNLFLGGLARIISETVSSFTIAEFLRLGLLFGGAAHLLVLSASVQVPGKLGWHQEFQKLSSLNRKIFWTYGGYIFSIIVFMSLVSFVLFFDRSSLSSPPILLWLVFIALFWWARVLTDFFYMSHEDWPKGPLFTVGHICLTTLFISLALLYSTLAVVSYGWIR